MSSTVAVITDSACDLPQEILDSLNIVVVPLSIRFDDEEFLDQVELSREDFWKRTNSAPTLPGTAAPSPGAFATAFLDAKQKGAIGVVCVTLSSDLSGTFQSAVGGAAQVKDEIDVRVVDSRTCTVAQARIVEGVAQFANEDVTLDQVQKHAEALADSQKMIGVLDTLEFLKKGGRIGAAGAFFAALLSVKPIITIDDGVVKPLSKQRTRSKSLKTLANMVIEQSPVERIGVSHTGANDVEEFVELLRPIASPSEILRTEVGPTIGVHGGPGLIAVTFARAK